MHRHGARDGLGRAEEGVDEGGGRLRAVAEGEVEVLEPEPNELVPVVLDLV